MRIILWMRQDLRLHDNPALAEASKRGEIIPLYIWAPEEESKWKPGKASQNWLYHSLEALKGSLPLVTRRGASKESLISIAKKYNATAVYWNRRYEPAAIKRDEAVAKALQKEGVEVKTFNSALLIEPWEISNKQGDPFRVFTPFWKTALKYAPFPVVQKPKLKFPSKLPKSDKLDLPKEPLAGWQAGEDAAMKSFRDFVRREINSYPNPTSQLSPYLHFGEISPRQIWKIAEGHDAFLRQIMWREFAYHLLFHFPQTTDHPLKEEFQRFPWKKDQRALRAWKEGKTGYPIVDAAMRQLWQMGWIHNRVRLIVASFLTKDLLIPWQEGAKWFWETLVDADLANNTLGWQWTAGSGADAAPYFRIFNPVLQGKKFDSHGEYIRFFVPELAELSDEWIHEPWNAPREECTKAGLTLGKTYPKPLVDHAVARERALKKFRKVKR